MNPATRPLSLRPLVAALALGAVALPGVAQTVSPYTFTASQRFSSDSNVFRRESGREDSDRISATSAGVSVNQPLGRQQLVADLNATRYNYSKINQLDNTGYNALVKLNLASAADLSGDLSFQQSQAQSAFVLNQTEKNLERNRIVSARGQLGMNSLWALEAGAAVRNVSESSRAFDDAELKAKSGNIGVRYRPSDLISFGLGYRRTNGNYLYGAVDASGNPDEFKRNDIDFTTKWTPSDITAVTARVSKTDQTHTVRTPRDQSLVTSALTMNWKPTGILGVELQWLRDTNEAIGTTGSTLETSSSGQAPITNAFQLVTNWNWSPAVQGLARFKVAKRSFDSALGQSGSDNTRSFGLGLTYLPVRYLAIEAGAARETRSSSNANVTNSNPYNVNTAFIGLGLRLN